jgi:hypothetical protein
MGLVKKVIEKIFPNGNDEVLKLLEDRSADFLKRIKGYGFETIQEFEVFNANYFRYRHSSRYPVGSDC